MLPDILSRKPLVQLSLVLILGLLLGFVFGTYYANYQLTVALQESLGIEYRGGGGGTNEEIRNSVVGAGDNIAIETLLGDPGGGGGGGEKVAATPTPLSHLECVNKACVVKDGAGGAEPSCRNRWSNDPNDGIIVKGQCYPVCSSSCVVDTSAGDGKSWGNEKNVPSCVIPDGPVYRENYLKTRFCLVDKWKTTTNPFIETIKAKKIDKFNDCIKWALLKAIEIYEICLLTGKSITDCTTFSKDALHINADWCSDAFSKGPGSLPYMLPWPFNQKPEGNPNQNYGLPSWWPVGLPPPWMNPALRFLIP